MVQAVAHSNIALIKYWGKASVMGNVPATPSISLTLEELTTRTTVNHSDTGMDHFRFLSLPGKSGKTDDKRLLSYLQLWRDKYGLQGFFTVNTVNNFPTGAGLASSASGYAALAAGLNAFLDTPLSSADLSRAARLGSGSAARSIFGGLVALPPGNDPAAEQIIPPGEVPWEMAIMQIQTGEKHTGSTAGMNLSRDSSPYFANWVKQGKTDYYSMLEAIEQSDFQQIGELMEWNTMAMHACILASRPSLCYWSADTLRIFQWVWEQRKNGDLQIYATADAGANVILLFPAEESGRMKGLLNQFPGVKVRFCHPGQGVQVHDV